MARHGRHSRSGSAQTCAYGRLAKVFAAVIAVVLVVALVAVVVTRCSTEGKPDASGAPKTANTAIPRSSALTRAAAPAPVDPAAEARAAKQTQLDQLATAVETQVAQYQGSWSVYVEDLATGAQIAVNDHSQPSASLIKLYVMLAVEERIAAGALADDAATESLMTQMITVSSNQATNSLVTKLGGGDAKAGMAAVNQTAAAHGFSATAMNDLLHDSASYDPYLKMSSASDCGRFLAAAYRGQLVSAQASARMVDRLLGQQRRSKIPAGLPAGTKVANKTGETSGVENDAAIVYAPTGDYVLVVMSERGANAASKTAVTAISATVWAALAG